MKAHIQAPARPGRARYLPLLLATLALCGPALAADEPSRATWKDLQASVFSNHEIASHGIVTLDAPYRAEDAAIVPMTIHLNLPAGDTRYVRKITLTIDENPSPVAAVITLGPTSGISRIETRVRVNSYTYVHAVAELSDGSMEMAEKYVKAAGGCSAPATKNQDEAMASLGKMKFRQFPAATGTNGISSLREAQLLVRHPNNSGLQMDQVTRNYVPARFINDLEIMQGKDLVLKVEGGISLSEDPTIRFNYRPNGAAEFSATVIDTDKAEFHDHWAVENGS